MCCCRSLEVTFLQVRYLYGGSYKVQHVYNMFFCSQSTVQYMPPTKACNYSSTNFMQCVVFLTFCFLFALDSYHIFTHVDAAVMVYAGWYFYAQLWFAVRSSLIQLVLQLKKTQTPLVIKKKLIWSLIIFNQWKSFHFSLAFRCNIFF